MLVPDKLVLAGPGRAADRSTEAPTPPPLPVLLRVPHFRQERPALPLPLPGSPRRRLRTKPVLLTAVLVVATAGLLLVRWQAWMTSIAASRAPAPRTQSEDTQTLPPLGPEQKASSPRAESSRSRPQHPGPGLSSAAALRPDPGTSLDAPKRSLDPVPGPTAPSAKSSGTAPPAARLVPWIEPIEAGGSP